MADEIDWTSHPARVLAAIAKARGEPIDDARVEALAALCDEVVQAPKFLVFVDALARLCQEHSVTLSTTGYDGLQVWDADEKLGPLHVNGIVDKTRPNEKVTRTGVSSPGPVSEANEG